ncbi:MAG TPA: hypothetical protein VL069_02450 [Opitutus sp.]|nr:hypothetical protein [Opitutus sp.]
MPHSPLPFHSLRQTLALVGFCLTALLVKGAETEPDKVPGSPDSPRKSPAVALVEFLDRLPTLVDEGLPSFAPRGDFRLTLRPRFGDLLRDDYFRLLVGARLKANEQLEFSTDVGTYFTHGMRDSVGNGLYLFRIGSRYEFAYTPDSGWSVGLDFTTPLSRPPYEITDGLRHTLPSVTYTRTISTKHGLVGFATLGLDLLDHTALPVNFSENQLQANSMILTLGVARQWRRMHVILRVFDGNTVLLSNRTQNVVGIRPSIGIPFLRRNDGTARATATFEGRAIWGPDGFETGVNTRIRLDLNYRRNRR